MVCRNLRRPFARRPGRRRSQAHREKASRLAEAAEVFQAILQQLGDTPTYERAATLGHLGRCFRARGRSDLAAQSAREAITVCDNLEPSDNVKRHRGVLLTGLADALVDQGKFAEARQAYQDGLKVVEELNDLRSQGVVLGQLGTLAMMEGNLGEGGPATAGPGEGGVYSIPRTPQQVRPPIQTIPLDRAFKTNDTLT